MKKGLLLFFILFTFLGLTGCNQTNQKEVAGLNNYKLELPKELEQYKSKFEKSVKPFINIDAKKGKTLAWESKLGGNPYLPIGYDYPKDINGSPMRLLAQINFEEVPDIGVFPSKGILEFYISAYDDVYGLNFDDQTSQDNFRVIYIPNVIKDNSKIINDFSFVDSSGEYFPIGNEGKLLFKVEYAPVSCEDFQFENYIGSTSFSFFDDVSSSGNDLWDWYEKKYSSAGHKMAGYAYFTQNDPRESSNSEYDILLIQIDTDDTLNIMWGDCGVANFFIKSEDLKNLDFSEVLYNWDCC